MRATRIIQWIIKVLNQISIDYFPLLFRTRINCRRFFRQFIYPETSWEMPTVMRTSLQSVKPLRNSAQRRNPSRSTSVMSISLLAIVDRFLTSSHQVVTSVDWSFNRLGKDNAPCRVASVKWSAKWSGLRIEGKAEHAKLSVKWGQEKSVTTFLPEGEITHNTLVLDQSTQ